jgi:catechol 2,3-dioxygenase-like lactoylglutathione lyase family enzyme
VLDHISLGVSDLASAGTFYDAALGPLGYARLFTKERGIGYGRPGAKDEAFAIVAAGAEARAPGTGCHVAFLAPSRAAVDAFHAAALRAGGVDEGAPGLDRTMVTGITPRSSVISMATGSKPSATSDEGARRRGRAPPLSARRRSRACA